MSVLCPRSQELTFTFYISQNLEKIKERDYAFYIELTSSNKRFYFSGDTKQETEEWRSVIANAASKRQENVF